MAKPPKTNYVPKPTYPGGAEAMRAFLKKHLTYPPEAKAKKIEGSVLIRYSVDYRGRVVEATVKKGIGGGCDEEALRLVKLLQFEIHQHQKRKVRVHQDLQLHFHLPRQQSAPPKTTIAKASKIAYSTSVANTSPKVDKPGGQSYSYTIEW